MTEERSMVARVFIGLWHFIDGTRKVFLNVLFLLLVFILATVLMQPEQQMRLKPDTTLVLRPYGKVVEQYSTEPMDRALQQAFDQAPPETRLRDMIEAIDRAAEDRDISQMLIHTDYLWGIGLSSLHDLERAISNFKAAGKPIYAMGDVMGQNQYYLASLADEVWLHPDGLVWIDGYANYRNFYREGLEKLEVEINLFRVGEYKSAMEPYVRDDMSPESREASLYWLGSMWQQYLEGVSRSRGVPFETLAASTDLMADRIEALEGDFAAYALELGLVDKLISRPEARQLLALSGTPNREGDGYRGVEFQDYLALTDLRYGRGQTGDISVLVAEGEIVSGGQAPGRIGADSTVEQLREVARNDAIKAIVLRVNSPGGDALASEKIRSELQAMREAGKTVVVSMGDVAASGGYWISLEADEVWANPSTITGSIGVYGLLPTFGSTLARFGIHSDGVGTTSLAGKLRLDRPLDADLRRVFQSSTEHVYDDFLTRVSEARGMTVEQVDEVAQGRVWSGSQAADRGLVDRVGSLHDAVDAAARIAGLGQGYKVSWYEPDVSPIEQFFLDLTSEVTARFSDQQSFNSLVRKSFVQELLEDLAVIAGTEGRFTIAAHCMCRIH